MTAPRRAFGTAAGAELIHGRVFHPTFSGDAGWSLKYYEGAPIRFRRAGRWMTLDEHVFVVVNAGEDYAFDIPTPAKTRVTAAFFSDADVRAAWASARLDETALLDLGPDAPVAPIEFANVLHRARPSPSRDLATALATPDLSVDERLSSLLVTAVDAEASQARTRRRLAVLKPAQRDELARRLSIARRFIEANTHRELSLDEAASEACLSKFYFLRRFREAEGLTPLAYHRELRLQHAAEAIAKGRTALADVAEASGYSEIAAFSRAFKRRFGCTASAFRAKGNPDQ